MKSLSVTIQMKAIKQSFHVVLFIMLCKVVRTFEFFDILKCELSKKYYRDSSTFRQTIIVCSF